MAAILSLHGLALLEHDNNGDTLWSWKYPSIDTKFEEVVSRKCVFKGKTDDGELDAVFGRFQNHWYYFETCDAQQNDKLPKVIHVGIIIITKDFNPELYAALGRFLLKDYLSTGTPMSVLELFLSVLARGKCESQDGLEFKASEYLTAVSVLNTSLKEFIPLFGIEFIIIYTALLLKRRVVVLANELNSLLKFCRSLPALVYHRHDWEILYPHVELTEEEVSDLKSRKSFLAGCLDIGIESRTDLYDILVNVSEREITINPNSKAYFQMGKLHKDIAMFLMGSAEDDHMSEAELVKELAVRTEAILTNLKSLAETGPDGERSFVTLRMLQSRNLSPAMQNFLYNLAHAEGLTQRSMAK